MPSKYHIPVYCTCPVLGYQGAGGTKQESAPCSISFLLKKDAVYGGSFTLDLSNLIRRAHKKSTEAKSPRSQRPRPASKEKKICQKKKKKKKKKTPSNLTNISQSPFSDLLGGQSAASFRIECSVVIDSGSNFKLKLLPKSPCCSMA
jgi:hypothetical protein